MAGHDPLLDPNFSAGGLFRVPRRGGRFERTSTNRFLEQPRRPASMASTSEPQSTLIGIRALKTKLTRS